MVEFDFLLDHEEGPNVLTATVSPNDAAANGFTLIELVVTLALFGILVSLGLPSFTAWIKNSQVRTVAEALQNGVRTAQAEAVRRNRQVVFALTDGAPPAPPLSPTSATAKANGKNWFVVTVAPVSDTTDVEYVQGGALADVASGVSISGPAAICFNSNGRLVANPSSTGISGAACTVSASTFDIDHPKADRALRVIVQLGGQMRMCDRSRPALSAAAPDGCPP